MKVDSKFKKWVLKKYGGVSVSRAVQTFAAECKPPLSYNTVQKWAEGGTPRPFYSDTLRGQFPDCPIFIKK